jgi:enoyl-CoA hydratase/carnithine racemase
MNMPELVLTSCDDGVLTLSLNRPEKRNALSLALIESLGAAVKQADAAANSREARVVVLGGEGPTFCAGMDLEAVRTDVPAMQRMLHEFAKTLLCVRALPCPTISRVQGGAVGGGCGLMVVTDFAFTHHEARIGYPEVSLGLTPAVVAPWLLRKIGAGRARAILLSGGTMTGGESKSAGIADHVVPREELDQRVAEFARKLAEGSPAAQAMTKRWLNELDNSLDADLAARAASISAEVIGGIEAQDSLRRIFGK